MLGAKAPWGCGPQGAVLGGEAITAPSWAALAWPSLRGALLSLSLTEINGQGAVSGSGQIYGEGLKELNRHSLVKRRLKERACVYREGVKSIITVYKYLKV